MSSNKFPRWKSNIQYFEGSTMAELYSLMECWQNENQKRLLSTSIEKDGSKYCCIALTTPSEVVIVNRYGRHPADVGSDGRLKVV